MKLIQQSMLALSVFAAMTPVTAMAETVAINNVTVHTASQQGVLQNATVVFDSQGIIAINPKTVSADKIIDGQGKQLTPGFISAMNSVGLVEVGAVKYSQDTRDDDIDMTFDPSLAFNPKSTAIAFGRKGGLTTSIVAADGGESIFSGQTFTVDMSGSWDSVLASHGALFVQVGADHEGSRAMAMQTLIRKLEDADKALSSPKASDKDEEPSAESLIINAVLAGDKTLIVHAERASDILQLLALKHRFKLDLVLLDAGDAVVVAEQIAAANVPVLLNGMRNLPESFDSLHNSLTNAGKLQQAGVNVVLTTGGGAHSIYGLRYVAGNAVANGMDYNQAMQAVTANAAKVFNIDAGQVAVGKRADLVLWSGDPFEYSTQVEQMWINGELNSTESRHDKLRERYTTDSAMPRAYTR